MKLFILCFFSIFLVFKGIAQVEPTSEWWKHEPYRIIQTNLREIDAIDFDVEVYVNSLKEIGANTVLINVGGIVANYYTNLEFHYQNPNLKYNLIKEVTERLHQKGIRVMGRFDFSKINEKLAEQKPEWLYKSENHQVVNYNGQVHTCINGGYQQTYSLKILDEVLSTFYLDGVFFNMIGYPMRDYGNNYHGICQCESCMTRFAEWSGGLQLPPHVDKNDSVFRKYDQFRNETKTEQFNRVRELIRSHGNHIAICTYTHAGTDLFRKEANSHQAFYNDFVPWEYQATSNVKTITGSWEGKLASNAAVHFFGYPARHSADARWLTQQRLVQNMIHGSGLDFYCIGRLDNLEDRLVLENVKDVYQFHQNNEKYLFHTHSGNRILVLHDGQSEKEYRGIVEFLSENHLLFDVMEHWCVGASDMPRKLDSYELIVLPDICRLSNSQCDILDEFVARGGKIMATGLVSTKDETGNPVNKIRIGSLGVEPDFEKFEKEQGTYYRIFEKDKTMLGDKNMGSLDIIYAWEEGLHCVIKPEAKGLLGYIPPAMIGPPEKCYYTEVTEIPGMIFSEFGKGKTVFFPFKIGSLYHHTRHYGHSMLLLASIKNLLEYKSSLSMTPNPLIEVSRQIDNAGTFEWYGLLNHSGQLGNAFFNPVDLYNIQLKFLPQKEVASIQSLKTNDKYEFRMLGNNWVELDIPQLGAYDVICVKYK